MPTIGEVSNIDFPDVARATLSNGIEVVYETGENGERIAKFKKYEAGESAPVVKEGVMSKKVKALAKQARRDEAKRIKLEASTPVEEDDTPAALSKLERKRESMREAREARALAEKTRDEEKKRIAAEKAQSSTVVAPIVYEDLPFDGQSSSSLNYSC